MKTKLDLGPWIYRLFLLSFLFAVLWVKGYLWWVFGIALVLFLSDTVVFPLLSVAVSLPAMPPARPRKPKGASQAGASGPAPGSEDFREPRPSRSSPQRRGP
jgi:hypothetical protein